MVDLNKFFESYLHSALFTATDDEGRPLDEIFDNDSFDPETKKRMLKDCSNFIQKAKDLLDQSGLDDDMAAHKFWLDRNGHGSGFWDVDDYKNPEAVKVGKALSDISKKFGEFDIYVGDDGYIHGGSDYVPEKFGVASADAEPEPEMTEDDLMTEDHSTFYQNGKKVLTLDRDLSEQEMWKALEQFMEKQKFWPNVWFISDHGNGHLMLPPRGIASTATKMEKLAAEVEQAIAEAPKFWVITANVVKAGPKHHNKDGSKTSWGVPTFILDKDIQGIMSREQAIKVGKKIVGALANEYDEVHVNAEPYDVELGMKASVTADNIDEWGPGKSEGAESPMQYARPADKEGAKKAMLQVQKALEQLGQHWTDVQMLVGRDADKLIEIHDWIKKTGVPKLR